ncbi:MAG TPA: hypothetical protein VHG27_00210, partial [Xanthobacteraceae bacterium]|nr:hypothetical protein [Xanthobacteraceae bacterium]
MLPISVAVGMCPYGLNFSANAQQQPSAEGDVPGMKVVVQELKRDEGGTVTLRFQLINDSDEEGLSDSCAFRENSSEGCGPMSGVHLLDGANKKKYLVVRDSGKTCVCSQFRPLKKGA